MVLFKPRSLFFFLIALSSFVFSSPLCVDSHKFVQAEKNSKKTQQNVFTREETLGILVDELFCFYNWSGSEARRRPAQQLEVLYKITYFLTDQKAEDDLNFDPLFKTLLRTLDLTPQGLIRGRVKNILSFLKKKRILESLYNSVEKVRGYDLKNEVALLTKYSPEFFSREKTLFILSVCFEQGCSFGWSSIKILAFKNFISLINQGETVKESSIKFFFLSLDAGEEFRIKASKILLHLSDEKKIKSLYFYFRKFYKDPFLRKKI